MSFTFKDAVASLEAATGDVQLEQEFTFYGKVANLTDLASADHHEKHEQHSLPCEVDGLKFRLRRIEATGNDQDKPVVYELTAKEKVGKMASEEITTEITKEMFAAMKQTSCEGYLKERYSFYFAQDPSLKWEFDVFFLPGGMQSRWVKIDLEFKNENMEIPNFPIEMEDVIWADAPDLSEEDKGRIGLLWGKHWSKLGDSDVLVQQRVEDIEIEVSISE